VQVSVGTLNRFQPGARVYPAVDPWDRNRIVEQQWHQFFGDFVRGNVPVRESYGPKAGFAPGYPDIAAVGIDYAGGFAHQPGVRKRQVPRYGPSREEARIHDGPCAQVHPTMSHNAWSSAEEEEESRRALARENRYHEARMIEIQERRRALESSGWKPGYKWCSVHQKWTRAS
jgi:hypothetical protein